MNKHGKETHSSSFCLDLLRVRYRGAEWAPGREDEETSNEKAEYEEADLENKKWVEWNWTWRQFEAHTKKRIRTYRQKEELLKKVYSRRGQELYLQNKKFNGRSQKAKASEQCRIYSYRKKNALIQSMSTQIWSALYLSLYPLTNIYLRTGTSFSHFQTIWLVLTHSSCTHIVSATVLSWPRSQAGEGGDIE